jgi:hypothetical protein
MFLRKLPHIPVRPLLKEILDPPLFLSWDPDLDGPGCEAWRANFLFFYGRGEREGR